MSETYEIYTPEGFILNVDKQSGRILFPKSKKPTGKYTQEYSKALFEADRILRNSPYKDYQPRYLDPNLYTGQSSTLLEFKDWQSIYLKDPIKGSIAPWTKAEKAYYAVGSGLVGVHKNPLREQEIKTLAKTLKPDEFGMLPFIDEIMGVDWVIDLNVYQFNFDAWGKIYKALRSDIVEGKIKDPRDVDSTYESRREFDRYMDGYQNGMTINYHVDINNYRSEESAKLFMDSLVLEAKLAALTPPQGYPNAPYYFSPERLEWDYKNYQLDKLLDPRIPAIYRYNFPQELRAKILAYAKEHNIKE
nr:hypothetical protein [Campylobacter lari]MCR6527570.1 hypothetical protein [Campylobacter lari]